MIGDAVTDILYDITYVFGDAVTDVADEDYDGGDLEDVHDEEKEPETERHLLPPPTKQTVYLYWRGHPLQNKPYSSSMIMALPTI